MAFPVDYNKRSCEWLDHLCHLRYQLMVTELDPDRRDKHEKELRKLVAEMSTRAAEWQAMLERTGWIPEQGTPEAGQDALSLPPEHTEFRVIQADEDILREMIFAESKTNDSGEG